MNSYDLLKNVIFQRDFDKKRVMATFEGTYNILFRKGLITSFFERDL